MSKRRIAITGTGFCIPHGRDREEVWAKIRGGASGVERIQTFDPSGLVTQMAGEVLYPIDTHDQVGPYPVIDGAFRFTIAATEDALLQAGIDGKGNTGRTAVIAATGVGPASLERFGFLSARYFQPGDNLRKRDLSDFYPAQQEDPVADELDIFTLDQVGPAMALMSGADRILAAASACASGSHAIADAGRAIRSGRADTVVVAGVCTAVNRVMIPGFAKIQALSNRNDEPQKASRPFDADRDGFVMAEGASALVLEDWEQAKARGATILAELLGWGYSTDAYRLTDPHPEGTGMAAAMNNALNEAGCSPDDIDYINAHGTSTPYNDAAETLAIKKAFGEERARAIAISSTKSMTGHLIHAAGTTEAIFSVMALRDQAAPPTINYTTPDPACDLDYVPNEARPMPLDTVVSNSFGFGGQNVSLVIGKGAQQ